MAIVRIDFSPTHTAASGLLQGWWSAGGDESEGALGVDLSAVPGLSGGVLCILGCELGTARHIKEEFRSTQAFASWLGLSPDYRISGGRR